MTDWYFAYGSNMNPARMEARGLAVAEVKGGHLQGFELCFNKRATGKTGIAYANIGYCKNKRVEGVLYRLANADDIVKMDPFEGNPVRYSREVFPITSGKQTINAWLYVANPAMIGEGLLPEQRYIEHLQAGKQWHSAAYQQWLLDHPTVTPNHESAEPSNGLIYNA